MVKIVHQEIKVFRGGDLKQKEKEGVTCNFEVENAVWGPVCTRLLSKCRRWCSPQVADMVSEFAFNGSDLIVLWPAHADTCGIT